MLSLDSPKWSELQHAYGSASDIPALLRQLRDLPDSDGEQEPWFSLWSSLAHQGDVYSASFAAVPHIVDALSHAPAMAPAVFFQFPAWVEICRLRKAIEVPIAIRDAYTEALAMLPTFVAVASARQWDDDFLVCALAAIAASKGFTSVAEAALELTPSIADEFLRWFSAK